jgi:hypothetical protein
MAAIILKPGQAVGPKNCCAIIAAAAALCSAAIPRFRRQLPATENGKVRKAELRAQV